MGASMKPEPTAYQKLAANLAYLRQHGASPDEIKMEIGRFRESQNAVSAAERKLSPVEEVGAYASKLGSGATFGLLDEAAGLFSEDTKNEQRFLQHQISEENPVAAGLTEVLGGLSNPVTFLRGAGVAAPLVKKAATVLGEGAIQGGIAGFGNAEGGAMNRAAGALKGAAAGAATAGAISGVAKGASKTFGRIGEALHLKSPELSEIANHIPEEDIASARTRLGELDARRLADEATVADVLPQGEGALRQAATSNREVRKTVDKELKSRTNRLSNLADDRFSEYTQTQPQSAARSVEDLSAEASKRAAPHYRAAAEEAGAAPAIERIAASKRAELVRSGVPEDKLPPMDAVDEALALPYVQQRIPQIKGAPRSRFAKLPDDDHAVLDQVYKDIGAEIRSLPREKWSLKHDLIQQRSILAEAITSRAPSYEKALGEFADPMARRDAYELGNTRAPADIIPSQLKELEGPEQAMFKEGKAALLRRDAPNMDIGEYARFQDVLAPIATKEKAAAFKATFGQKAYDEYAKDLLEMAGLQRMKAGGGESTTADKLLEQLQSDPEAIVGMVGQLLRGNAMAAAAQFAPSGAWGRAIDRLRNNAEAKQNADFLLQRGKDKVSSALDYIEHLRKQGKLPRPRNWKEPNGSALAARLAGAVAGKY